MAAAVVAMVTCSGSDGGVEMVMVAVMLVVSWRIYSDTYTGNPVKKILLKMNLPDHRSVLTDPEVHVKMEMEIPRSSGVNS
ncbi:hypothetical protein Tco_0854755 [Tanacetum coccineum]